MTFLRFSKKVLKIAGIIVCSIVLVLAIFYWWFVNHAEKAIEDLVSMQSKGKLKVEIGKIRYNYGQKLGLFNVTFYTADSAQEKTAYRFTIEELHLKTRSVKALIMDKQLLIDSVLIKSPDITITQLVKTEKKHLSLPEEMGKIYESIHNALSVLQIKHFEIDNATVTLTDKIHPDLQPLTLSRLYFRVDNFRVDSSSDSHREKFLFSDNVVLRADHQQFTLPDGRHSIGFRQFRINIRQRLVEIDSCTITANKKPGARASFKAFLDTLKLTDVDFTALSRHGLVRADSVYCVDPSIELDVELDSAGGKHKKPVNIQHLLRHLAGDMQLKYIGVKNASVQVITQKNNRVNTFSSRRNSFELFNLVIDTKAEEPVSVEKFLMAIRHYEAYGRDSAYLLRFDSVNFTNHRILLNNFSITTNPKANVVVRRDYHIPLFELQGFSWQELIFNRHIKATEAVLHRPVLHYRKMRQNDSAGKKSIYEIFEVLDTLMSLDRIRMIEGTLDFQLNAGTRLRLQKVNGVVNTNQLLQATSSGYIEQSVEGLSFSHATVATSTMNAMVEGVSFDGNSQSLLVKKLSLHNKKRTFNAIAKGLSLKGLLINDSSHNLQVNHIGWKQAAVQVQLPEKKDSTKAGPPLDININGIDGAHTELILITPKQTITTHIERLSANTISRDAGEQLQVKGLHLHGKDLVMKSPETLLQLAQYDITDGKNSTLRSVQYHHYKGMDSVSFVAPSINITPDLAQTANGPLQIHELIIRQPVARISLAKKDSTHHAHKKEPGLPELAIRKLVIEQPVIHFTQSGEKGSLSFSLNATGKSSLPDKITATNIRTSHHPHTQLLADHFQVHTNTILFTNSQQKETRLSLGTLGLTLEQLSFHPTTKHPEWSALVKDITVHELQHHTGGAKETTLYLESGNMQNLHLSSTSLHSITQTIANSPAWQFNHLTGHYHSDKDEFRWKGVHFDAKAKVLSLDSFAYSPVLSRDAFIAAHPFQTDYIRVKTGPIHLQQVDPATWFRDSLLTAHTLVIQQPAIEVFRNKRPPFQHGIIKPLPVNMLKKIPFRLNIDTIRIRDMYAEYAELSEKTNRTGTIHFTRLNALLFPVKNYHINTTDSFRLRAEALLLDTIPLRLRMRESYTDSLAGFLMNVNMAPADLTLLNPILEPLASVKLRSGMLDTMTMRAVGREYLSLGEMRLFYNNLHVRFLKNGSETKKNFLTGLMTFVANSFIIKKQNTHKTGVIYFPRFRDRSIFNYWIKMTLSGAASSVGAKSNKKALRKYRRELKHRGLPPIEL